MTKESVTYYAVQPFTTSRKGGLEAGVAVPAQTRDHAERIARRAGELGGAIAFSRTGNPQLGDWQDAQIIGVFGTIPEDAIEMMTAAA